MIVNCIVQLESSVRLPVLENWLQLTCAPGDAAQCRKNQPIFWQQRPLGSFCGMCACKQTTLENKTCKQKNNYNDNPCRLLDLHGCRGCRDLLVCCLIATPWNECRPGKEKHRHTHTQISVVIPQKIRSKKACSGNRAAGAPAQWSDRYMRYIISLRYRYRFLDNTAGPEFNKQCGIPQGDAMSVVVALLMLVALTQSLVKAADGAAEIRMYLDDLTVRTRDGAVLDTVDNEVREYARRWGIKLSPKSIAFATDRAHHTLLRRLNHPVVEEFKWLGTFHHLCSRDRPLALRAFTTKVATTRARLKRLQWAHLPWNLRQHLISTNVMAGLCWYPLGQPVEAGVLKSLELSVF